MADLLKTSAEIVSRMRDSVSDDLFGTQRGDLLEFLPFDVAREWLKEETTAEQWAECFKQPTREAVLNEMREYFDFAVGKALDERGLSANRSIFHFTAWVWLLGDEEMLRFLDDGSNYSPYGAPMLLEIARKYDLRPKEESDLDALRKMAGGRRG